MTRKLAIILFVLVTFKANAQKIDSIYFNLYTDSLKKGVYNYINVDGKLKSGTFTPLMDDELTFKSSVGEWQGNSLLIDTAAKDEKVTVTAFLKSRPAISCSTVIYLKKINTDPVLKTEKEVIEGYKHTGRGER